ncbi:MAG: hypothetical protein NC399_05415 [Muribaculum sp.]|nr:hypothetical protein [Muribaculum sp.]
MRQLYYFEFKKILQRKVNQIAALLGFLLMIACTVFQIRRESLRDDGREFTGAAAILRQETVENALTAELDEPFLTDLVREYQRQASSHPDGYDYTLIEAKSNLFACIAKNYTEWNEHFDWKVLNRIPAADGIGFYDRRISKIETLLNAEYSYGNYTEAEKEYWLQKAETVRTPFRWGSPATWDILWNVIALLFFLFFVISICIAPVFAGEYQNRMDALLLTAKYGKSKVIAAKIMASFTFSFLYIALCCTVCTGIIGGLLGIDGGDLPVQLWDTVIPYPMTVRDACAWNLLILFLIASFLTAFSLLLSALSKSPMVVLAIDIVCLWGTVFLPSSKTCSLWNRILYLLPVHCFDLQTVLKTYTDYPIGNHIFSYLEMIFITYIGLTAVCLLCTGKGFTAHQVKR